MIVIQPKCTNNKTYIEFYKNVLALF